LCRITKIKRIESIIEMYEEPFYGGVIHFSDGEKIGSAFSHDATIRSLNLKVDKH
jgi:hypothetical protein